MQLTLPDFLAYSALGVRYRYLMPSNSDIDPMHVECDYCRKNYSPVQLDVFASNVQQTFSASRVNQGKVCLKMLSVLSSLISSYLQSWQKRVYPFL